MVFLMKTDNTNGKTRTYHFRLTEAEHNALEKFCGDQKRSVVLRRMIRETISHGPSFFPEEISELKKLQNQIRAVGKNINQIARLVNVGKVTSDPISYTDFQAYKSQIDVVSDYLSRLVKSSEQRRVHLRKMIACKRFPQ